VDGVVWFIGVLSGSITILSAFFAALQRTPRQ